MTGRFPTWLKVIITPILFPVAGWSKFKSRLKFKRILKKGTPEFDTESVYLRDPKDKNASFSLSYVIQMAGADYEHPRAKKLYKEWQEKYYG